MTEQQLQRLRELLTAGKTPDERASEQRIYLRGFNGGIDFAEQMIAKVLQGEV